MMPKLATTHAIKDLFKLSRVCYTRSRKVVVEPPSATGRRVGIMVLLCLQAQHATRRKRSSAVFKRNKRSLRKDQQTYLITFDDVSPAVANRYAEEMRSALLKASSDVEVQRKREDPRAQDFGATLVLVLGAPAVVTAVKGMGDWLQRCHGVGLTMKTENGEVIATNLTSKDALKLAELLRSSQQ